MTLDNRDMHKQSGIERKEKKKKKKKSKQTNKQKRNQIPKLSTAWSNVAIKLNTTIGYFGTFAYS